MMYRILTVALLFFSMHANAQIGNVIGNLNKEGSKVVAQAEGATVSTLLGSMDNSIRNQFSLDGVKSQLTGDLLKIRVADTDFAKLNSTAKSQQATQIINAAKNYAGTGGSTLRSIGVKTVVVDMVKSMSVTDVIQTVKTNL